MSLSSKLYLVTGSTDGIGKHTVMKLAKAGASVIVHGRSSARVEQAVKEVQGALGGKGEAVGYVADLSEQRQVRELAARVKANHPPLTGLINNAGVFEQSLTTTADGFELTWAVNVLAPFLLTSLLVPGHIMLGGRVLNVSSISASGRIDFDNLNQEKGFSEHNAYSLSKLAAQLFTAALAARLTAAGSDVCTLTCDPGTVNTKMLYAGWGPCGIPVSSADDEYRLVTDPALQSASGTYYVGCRKSGWAYRGDDRQQVQERLWAVMEAQTGAAFDLPPPAY